MSRTSSTSKSPRATPGGRRRRSPTRKRLLGASRPTTRSGSACIGISASRSWWSWAASSPLPWVNRAGCASSTSSTTRCSPGPVPRWRQDSSPPTRCGSPSLQAATGQSKAQKRRRTQHDEHQVFSCRARCCCRPRARAGRDELSEQTDPHHRALYARQRDRHRRAAGGREAERGLGSAGHRRESPRGRWHDRHCTDGKSGSGRLHAGGGFHRPRGELRSPRDRKSTRLNSSHMSISYAVFCLKKKKKKNINKTNNKNEELYTSN